MKKHDILYEKLKQSCLKANELLDEGWILYDNNGDIVKGKFSFKSNISPKEEAIGIQYNNMFICYVTKDKCTSFGESTLLKEYRKAEKILKEHKFVPVKYTINFFEII